MKFIIYVSVMLLSFSSVAQDATFDNNFLYGFRGFLTKKPHEKVISFHDINSFYVVSRPLTLNIIDSNHSDLNYIILQQDTLLSILDKEGDHVTIAVIDSDQQKYNTIPVYKVFERQLWTSRLVKVGTSLALIDELNGQPVVAPMNINHSDLHENQKRRKGKKLILKCYARVKRFLLRHQLVDDYLPGISAKVAEKHLKDHGFQQVIGPRSAPVGSVCVYSGGWHGHGHIEVKRGARCWWYGYGCKPSPVRSRKLMGCYHKGWGAQNFAIK